MPDKNYSLQTEYDYSSRTLIIDEIGELPTLLVDLLLSHGNFVYYFGKTQKEEYYYLLEKKNFQYCSSIEEIKEIGKLDYVYSFPEENSRVLNELSDLPGYLSAKYLICHSTSFSEKTESEKLLSDKNKNVRRVVYDEVFGKRIRTGILGQIFVLVGREEKILIERNQTQEISPVSAERLVAELPKIIYSSDTQNKTFILQSPKITVDEFAGLIKKNYREVEFSFHPFDKRKAVIPENCETVQIEENLEDKITETLEWFKRNNPNSAPDSEPVLPEVKPETKAGLGFLFNEETKQEEEKSRTGLKRKILFGFFLFFLFILIFFGIPLFLTVIFGLSGLGSMADIPAAVGSGNLPKAIIRAEKAEKLFGRAQKIISVSSPFYSLIGLDKPLGKINDSLTFSQNISKTYKYGLTSAETIQGWFNLLINGSELSLSESEGVVRSGFSLAYQEASLAQLLLEKAGEGYKFLGKQKEFENLKKVLPERRDSLLKVQNIIPVLSKILGTKDRKTYLVLLQNNLELRPTGGFISAYGIASFENGKLISFEVDDVYRADNLLKGKVDPPKKIIELLGETTWYLRDSNWEPDFPASAQKAQWFLDKEIQLSTDGVIAVNLTVFQRILEVIGEINLPDYPQKITSENFWSAARNYPEKANFSSGGTKGDFVSLLTKTIWEKTKSLSREKQAILTQTMFELLEEKEILLYSNEADIQKIFGSLGWEGSIKKSLLPPRQNVIVDYLFINETNVGINKVNFDINRKIEHQVTIEDSGLVKEKLLIDYHNLSVSENWPSGPYKNYLRLYLPDKAAISSVLITDIENPQLWVPFDSKLVDISSSYGKTEVGLFMEIPVKSERKLEISYELPVKADFSEKTVSYLLLLQKQSGVAVTDYSLVFSSPAGLVPLRVIPRALVSGGKLLVSEKINRDFVLQVDLAH